MYGVITQKLCGVNETDDIIKELFKTFLDNNKGSDFVFASIELLDYHLHKIILKREKSYIRSPKWLENKKNNNKSAK